VHLNRIDWDGRSLLGAIVRDVTEKRLREQRLTEALQHEKELTGQARAGELAKSEFLAVMSHEIRTPMNGILGFAELLAQTSSLPDECRDYVETISTSSENLLRILDDILLFSRLEAGRVQIEKIAFEPREMLEEIRILLAPSAQTKGLDFKVAVDQEIPEKLLGDVGRLRQVLLNLAGNAIKFTDQGQVEMGLHRTPTAPGLVEFFVRDTGVGIAAGKLEEIFQPFVQADGSVSRRHGGTGLGLTISRRLTELMEGQLRVQSNPGKGTLFRVTVPMEAAGPESGQDRIAEKDETLDATFAGAHPLSILFVRRIRGVF
jgi:signal transduction histidine kinase